MSIFSFAIHPATNIIFFQMDPTTLLTLQAEYPLEQYQLGLLTVLSCIPPEAAAAGSKWGKRRLPPRPRRRRRCRGCGTAPPSPRRTRRGACGRLPGHAGAARGGPARWEQRPRAAGGAQCGHGPGAAALSGRPGQPEMMRPRPAAPP